MILSTERLEGPTYQSGQLVDFIVTTMPPPPSSQLQSNQIALIGDRSKNWGLDWLRVGSSLNRLLSETASES